MRLKIAILFLFMLVSAQAVPSPAPSPAPVAANKPAEVKPAENKKLEESKKNDAKKPAEQPKQQPNDNKKPDEHKKDEQHKELDDKKPEVLTNRDESHKPDDNHKDEARHQGDKRREGSDERNSESDEDDSGSDEDNSESDEDGSYEDDDDEMSTFELEQHLKHEIQLRYQRDIEQIMKFVFRLTDLKNHKGINQNLFEVSPSEATLKCVAPMFERMISSVSACEHAADEHVKAIEMAYRKLQPEERKERNHWPEQRGEYGRRNHDSWNSEKHDSNGRQHYYREIGRDDDRQEYHRKFDRNHYDNRKHEDYGRKGHQQYYGEHDRNNRPIYHDRDHYEARRQGNENHREEKHHSYGDARRDNHGIPCRNHHEDEMRMAHEIFVGQCFINSLVANKDKASNHSVLNEAKMKQEINMTLLAKPNKDKAMTDLHSCLAAPKDVTHLVEMMAGVKHFTIRMISPMVSALYNNQQPSMSTILQGQSKLMDIKNNLYNLKGMICLVESLAKNGCGAVVTQHGNMPQGRR